jgi:hypothetical protein
MVEEIITIFCCCDDFLKAINFQDDKQAVTSSAEIMTAALVAAHFFKGDQHAACDFLSEHNYIPRMVSKSQFNRRLHAIDEHIWCGLLSLLAQLFKQSNRTNEYIVDSLPIAVCESFRIARSKLITNRNHLGYVASKGRYIFGFKLHVLATVKREPVEFMLEPASFHDMRVFKKFTLNLAPRAIIYGDLGYTDYKHEKRLKNERRIVLAVPRKRNAKAPMLKIYNGRMRKRIETMFSDITKLFPKSIHAVTRQGFVLKVLCFILAYSCSLKVVTT